MVARREDECLFRLLKSIKEAQCVRVKLISYKIVDFVHTCMSAKEINDFRGLLSRCLVMMQFKTELYSLTTYNTRDYIQQAFPEYPCEC